MSQESFSKRNRYNPDKEITVREDAPHNLRYFVLDAVKELGLDPYSIRVVLCRVLRTPPDDETHDNPANQIDEMMYGCEWFRVYDIIEGLYAAMAKQDAVTRKTAPKFATAASTFAGELNGFFIEEGVGWQLVDGQIVARGDKGFQDAVKMAATQLNENQRPTAASHIKFAVKALSERPTPDTAGAVAHATSAVECLLNDITGQVMTLGKYLDKHQRLFHPALKKALDGVYGYASDAGARHGREGREPSFDEAQFALTTCVAACTLLTATNPKQQ